MRCFGYSSPHNHLTDLNLSDNRLAGPTRRDYSKPWDTDIDNGLKEWTKTCDKLKSSHLVTLSLQTTGLGAEAVQKLATLLPTVVFRELNCRGGGPLPTENTSGCSRGSHY